MDELPRNPCYYYGIFDSVIRSDRPLSELPRLPRTRVDCGDFDVRFEAASALTAAANDIRLRPWSDDSDRVVQGRFGESILIRVLALADYVIRPAAGLVVCHPCPQAHPSAVRHFLMNQILPRLVSVRDPLVIHASAVVTGHGAIALIGPAGVGKSTLATSFAISGAGALISDDGILVRLAGHAPRLVGAYPRSRLRPDSFDALELGGQASTVDFPVAGKHLLRVLPDRVASVEPMAIRGLFLLAPAESGGRDIAISPLTGSAAVMALIGNSFLLEPSDRSQLRSQFEAATALVRTGCPFYSLTYPRRFSELPQVRVSILSALGA